MSRATSVSARLEQSPVTALASLDWLHRVIFCLPRLPCLTLFPVSVYTGVTRPEMHEPQLSWGSCFSSVVVLAKSVSAEWGLDQLEGAALDGGGLGEHGDLGAGEAGLVAGGRVVTAGRGRRVGALGRVLIGGMHVRLAVQRHDRIAISWLPLNRVSHRPFRWRV